MKPYDTYKDSGIEWIGEIPSHWEVKKVKYNFSFRTGFTPSSGKTEYYEDGTHIWINISDLQKRIVSDSANKITDKAIEDYKPSIVPKGSLLYSFKLSVGRVAFNERDCYTNEAIFSIDPDKNTNLDFFYYSLPQQIIKNANENIYGAQILNQELIKNAVLIVPTQKEQNAIATFLDRKTAEIDALIADKKRLLELYEEEKTAVINQAVTKGIDPKAKMKDSGIEWLGEIPEHWEVKKLKFIIKGFESGVSVNSLDNPIIEGEYGILKTSCVYDYSFRPEENKLILNDFELQRAKINPKKGMIIISRMNTPDLVGASGYVDQDYPNLFLPDRLWQTVFYQGIELDSKWLSYIFKSSSFRKLLSTLATGTSPSMKNLGQEDFLNIKIPFQGIEEQQSIVKHIETECTRIGAKIDKTKKLIELLTEYRTALISEVVTGKLKVV